MKDIIPEMKRKIYVALVSIIFFTGDLDAQIFRGDTTRKKIALVFTGDEFGDGGPFICSTLQKHNVKASFFLTGNFYRNPPFKSIVRQLIADGHYMGSHSDKHLLYCDWNNRDSLLVTRNEFEEDLDQSYKELNDWGIAKEQALYFLPPYEWYNDSIVEWTKEAGLQLINYTPGTMSTADYTYPEMGTRYADSRRIFNSILNHEKNAPSGLNGFILLVHIGTDPRRKDKFYYLLPDLLSHISAKGYEWVRVDELLDSRQ